MAHCVCITRTSLQSLSARASLDGMTLKLCLHAKDQGKGAAIQTEIPHMTGDIVLIQDADLEYGPQDYASLLKPILDGWADVVFGNRLHGGAHRVLYFWHFVGNKFLTTLCYMVTNLNLCLHVSFYLPSAV